MMISRELEVTLGLAVREAAQRRHEYLTLEHVLHALLNDSDVAEVIRQCGGDVEALRRDLGKFLDQRMDRLPENVEAEPQQTLGFRRVLQRAALHVQSSGKDQISGRDILVAIFREPDSHAAHLLEGQGITRLDVVSYISHGISKIAVEEPAERESEEDAEDGGETRRLARSPLESFAVNLNQRAADGDIDPLIGRELEIERTIHVLCRRR